MFRNLLAGAAITVTIALLLPACTERTPLDPANTGAPSVGESDDDITTSGIDGLVRIESIFGDGDERIGVAAGGVGLRTQSAVLTLDVPAANDDAIQRAFFTWCGRSRSDEGDDTIVIDGTEYTGDLLAKFPHSITPERWAFVYRHDATPLVHAGPNSFEVSGFDLGEDANEDGISLVVLYADPKGYDRVEVIELADFFYWAAPVTGGNSDVHTFEFEPAGIDLDASFLMVVGDCEAERPDVLWWEIGEGGPSGADIIGLGESEADVLVSAQGAELDILSRDLTVPAGADHLSFQIESPRDGDGDSGLLTLAVFCVNSEVENLPPVCDAGGPYTAEAGETITLDGSGSSDPDGKIIGWRWDLEDKVTAEGEVVEYAWDEPGEYPIRLCIEDDDGASSCCDTVVLVTEPARIVCNSGGPYEGIPGKAITFDGSGTQDPDGLVVTYRWSFGDGSAADGMIVQHAYEQDGNYTAQLCLVFEDESETCCPAAVNIFLPSAN